MKALLVGLLVMGAFAGGWYARGWRDQQAPDPSTPWAQLTPQQRAVAEAQSQKCRDACEQLNIFQRLGDDWLRNCLSTCAAPKTYEPIRSITRAPADHSRTIENKPLH